MSFAENLKIVRKEQNISQEHLAEMLEVSRQAVSKWESGNGYPETEKLLLLSKRLNISLDYLLLDKNHMQEDDKHKSKNNITVTTGKISICSFDGKSIVTCHKVSASKIMYPGKNEPKYLLSGVDKVTFWGENTTTLGWYVSEEDITNEINEIRNAINLGIPTYELKYAANVEIKFFGAKIIDK